MSTGLGEPRCTFWPKPLERPGSTQLCLFSQLTLSKGGSRGLDPPQDDRPRGPRDHERRPGSSWGLGAPIRWGDAGSPLVRGGLAPQLLRPGPPSPSHQPRRAHSSGGAGLASSSSSNGLLRSCASPRPRAGSGLSPQGLSFPEFYIEERSGVQSAREKHRHVRAAACEPRPRGRTRRGFGVRPSVRPGPLACREGAPRGPPRACAPARKPSREAALGALACWPAGAAPLPVPGAEPPILPAEPQRRRCQGRPGGHGEDLPGQRLALPRSGRSSPTATSLSPPGPLQGGDHTGRARRLPEQKAPTSRVSSAAHRTGAQDILADG